jgi:hypothetical protein
MLLVVSPVLHLGVPEQFLTVSSTVSPGHTSVKLQMTVGFGKSVPTRITFSVDAL